MTSLGTIAVRRPRITLSIWLAVLIAAASLAVQLGGALSGGGFTNSRAEALTTQAVIEHQFGDQPNQFAIAVSSDHALADGTVNEVADALVDRGATAVTTPADEPSFLSKDRKTALIVAGFDGSNTDAQNLTPVLQRQLSSVAGADMDVYVTGQPALDYQLNVHSKEDATRAELIVFPLLLVVLLLVFRSVVATLLPLLMAASALGIASGVGFLLTRVMELSNLYSNIVSMIGLAVAVDYSLFIIKRFREELAAGADARVAVRGAMSTAGRSVIFSGVAVILALASLLIPNVMAFTSIALGGIIVTLAALLVTSTVLPATLILLGRNIDRWRIPHLARRRHRERGNAGHVMPRRGYRLLGLAAAAGMVALATPVMGLSLQSPVASATILPAHDSARVGLELINREISDAQLFPVQVVLELPRDATVADGVGTVADAKAVLESESGVHSVSSVLDGTVDRDQLISMLPSPRIPESVARVWSAQDGSITTRLLVETVAEPDSVAVHELVTAIRSELPAQLPEGTDVRVAGATAQGVDFDNTIVQSIPLIAAVVIALTLILLTFAFRSLLLPVLAIFFNGLVVGASLGLLTLIQALISDQPLNSVTPILLFAVMFGLSMDYMVIIIARMIESFEQGAPFEQAVMHGMRRTRSMINSAALIMITVFLAFMTGQISIVREIGIGLAIAVALDALVVRMLVMPAVLLVVGPRSFGRHRTRRHRRHTRRVTKPVAGDPEPVTSDLEPAQV